MLKPFLHILTLAALSLATGYTCLTYLDWGFLVSALGSTAIAGFGFGFCCCGGCNILTQASFASLTGWTQTSGSWTATSGQAQTSSTSAILLCDTASTDGTAAFSVVVDATGATNNDTLRIYSAWKDSSNYIYAEIGWGLFTNLSIVQVVAGSPSTLISTNFGAVTTAGTETKLRLCINTLQTEARFVANVGGTEKSVFAAITATGSSYSKFGVGTGTTLSGAAKFRTVTVDSTKSGCPGCPLICFSCTSNPPTQYTITATGFTSTCRSVFPAYTSTGTGCQCLNGTFVVYYFDQNTNSTGCRWMTPLIGCSGNVLCHKVADTSPTQFKLQIKIGGAPGSAGFELDYFPFDAGGTQSTTSSGTATLLRADNTVSINSDCTIGSALWTTAADDSRCDRTGVAFSWTTP